MAFDQVYCGKWYNRYTTRERTPQARCLNHNNIVWNALAQMASVRLSDGNGWQWEWLEEYDRRTKWEGERDRNIPLFSSYFICVWSGLIGSPINKLKKSYPLICTLEYTDHLTKTNENTETNNNHNNINEIYFLSCRMCGASR